MRIPLVLALALASAFAVLPSLASAGVPCGICNSTVPLCVTLVGAAGDAPAAEFGEFVVIMRDLANNPIAGAMVVIDLSNAPDMHFCADQMDPTMTVDCANNRVSKVTAADGSVHFTLLGGSNGAGNASTLLNGGMIFANGVLLQYPTVAAYDLDGSGGVGANDVSALLGDFGLGQPFGRCDYDCSGNVGANDLSLWLKAYGSGTMTRSCGSSCP